MTRSRTKVQEYYIMRVNQFIVYVHIYMQCVVATGGKHFQRPLWHLEATSESHEPQYIVVHGRQRSKYQTGGPDGELLHDNVRNKSKET